MKAESIIKRRGYDHRLRDYVRVTGDVSFAISLGVPRSTARSWLGAPIRSVVSHESAGSEYDEKPTACTRDVERAENTGTVR